MSMLERKWTSRGEVTEFQENNYANNFWMTGSEGDEGALQ